MKIILSKMFLPVVFFMLIFSSFSEALSLTSPFLNYPNPFKTRDSKVGTTEGTYFAYGLSSPANIEIRIYMIDGTLVWKRSFLSTDPEGSAGYHEVFWDGALDTGASRRQASGYILRETAPNGILLSFLIANGKVLAKNKITVFQ